MRFAIALALILLLSLPARADVGTGILRTDLNHRSEVAFGDVQHYRLTLQPGQPMRNAYAMILFSSVTAISVDSLMPCTISRHAVLCHQSLLTSTTTIDVRATVVGPQHDTIIVGDAISEQWRMQPPVHYFGTTGTIPQISDLLMKRLFLPIAER